MSVIDEKSKLIFLIFSLLFTYLASIFVSDYSTISRDGAVKIISANVRKNKY